MAQFKKFQLRWNESLGDKACPYMRRWVFIFGGYSIRVHQWYRSDDKRFFHDHGWDFITLVIRGSYTDVSDYKREVLTAGNMRYRKAEHKHYVEVPPCGCTTLLFCKPPRRNWGFWVDGKFRRPLKFFHKYGHPPCSEQ